jgi:hypothetical protein
MPQSIASGSPLASQQERRTPITQFHWISRIAPPHDPAAALYQNTPPVQPAYVGAGLQPGQPAPIIAMEHESRVHYLRMRNITLSADEQLIEQARLLAKSRHKTLNAMFREWLEQLTAQDGGTQEYDSLMKRLKHVQAGRRFTRDEMNER